MSRESGVAVVIPAWRSEAWLPEAIGSVLEQTLPPSEVIVVDDGSPDGVEAVCLRFRDSLLYARQENRGPGAARNLGIALTEAPLIAFLDADDRWEPQKLARQVAFLHENPEVALVCSEAWSFEPGGELRRRRPRASPPPSLSLPDLCLGNPIATLTVMVRRRVLAEVGGFDEDPGLLAVEDYDLWLRIAERHPLAWIPEPLGRYRRHGASLSGARRFYEGVGRVLDRAARRNEDRPGILRMIRRHRIRLCQNLAWELCARGEARRAFGPIWEAMGMGPTRLRSWKLLFRALMGSLR